MGCLICAERKPTSFKTSTANGFHSKSRQDHSTLKKRTLDAVPRISKSDKSATSNDVTLYESVNCVTSKNSHNYKTSSSNSDDKSYAKVLSAKGNMSRNDSRSYETVRGFHLADSQSVSTCSRVGTQYASTDQVNISAINVRNTEHCTEQCCEHLQDMCTLCASNRDVEQATHICLTCSTFGRYFCYNCIHTHSKFYYGHDIRSLSGSAYCNSQNTERIGSIHSYARLEFHRKHNEQLSESKPKTEMRSQNSLIALRPERAKHDQIKMAANLSNEETYRNYKTAEWINKAANWRDDRPAVQVTELMFPSEQYYNKKMQSCNEIQHEQHKLMGGDNTASDLSHQQIKETSENYVTQCAVSTQHYETVGNTDTQRNWKNEGHNFQTDALRAQDVDKRSDKAKNDYNVKTMTNEATYNERNSPKLQQVENNVNPSVPRTILTRRHESMNKCNKISKQFSDLYNKEWTDGFNALVHTDKGNKTERQACDLLLRVLITDNPSATLKDDGSELHNNLIKTITGEVWKSFHETLSRQDRLLIAKYINRCSSVCILMTYKEPRVGMDTDIDQNGEHFNTRRYKPYRPQGTVADYIIWPALYVEDNDTILNKGIVQAQKPESYT